MMFDVRSKLEEMRSKGFIDTISRIDMYAYIGTFLTVLIAYNAYMTGWQSTLPQVLMAVLVASSLDIAIKYIRMKRFVIPRSATITGLLVASVLQASAAWYVVASAAALAIIIKHTARFKEKHVFNPAAIGIVLVQLIFGTSTGWWAALPLSLVAAFGLLQTWKMRNYYQVSFFVLASLLTTAVISGSLIGMHYVLANSTLLFFMFFMFTEPKTSPYTRNGKILYGILLGALVQITTLYISGQIYPTPSQVAMLDPYLAALVIGNLVVPFIRKYVK